MKNLSKKQIDILLLSSIVSGLLMTYCLLFYTLPNERYNRSIPQYEYQIRNNNPCFDYFNGLWLMFGGIMFFSVFCLLFMPNKIEILKLELKRDFNKKRWKDGF